MARKAKVAEVDKAPEVVTVVIYYKKVDYGTGDEKIRAALRTAKDKTDAMNMVTYILQHGIQIQEESGPLVFIPPGRFVEFAFA